MRTEGGLGGAACQPASPPAQQAGKPDRKATLALDCLASATAVDPLGRLGVVGHWWQMWAPTAAATSGARRTCPAAAGEAQADRQRSHPASLVALV